MHEYFPHVEILARARNRNHVYRVMSVRVTFQFAVVNVRLAAETLPSAALLLATGITTLASGWLNSTSSEPSSRAR